MKVLGPGSEPFLVRDKEGKEPEELDEKKKAMMPTELLGAKHPPKEEDRDDS